MPEERLQKVLARAGQCSRREAESLIASGRVTVNGAVVQQPGARANLDRDVVSVDGRRVRPAPREYWVHHKPPGIPLARGGAVVMAAGQVLRVGSGARLFSVGRLDAAIGGLLLLTNDGELAHRLLKPGYRVDEDYAVRVAGRPDSEDLRRLRRGMPTDGQVAFAAHAALLPPQSKGVTDGADQRLAPEATWLELTVTDRVSRRRLRWMLNAIGHPAQRIVRTRMGPLHLRDLAEGATRGLEPDERVSLRSLLETPALRLAGPSDPVDHR